MPYPEEMVAPMRQELVACGVQELRTADEVERFMADAQGTSLVIVNSVCGCAAGAARPAVAMALKGEVRPDRVATVFAGQDLEATAKAREYFGQVPPSSPSMALFRDGRVVGFVPRHAIEGRRPQDLGNELSEAFQRLFGQPQGAGE